MMSKKGWVLFPVLLAGLALTSPACSSGSDGTAGTTEPSRSAAPGAPGANIPGPSAGETTREATGKVVLASPTQKILVVKSNVGDEMTFEVKEAAAGDLVNVKPGDQVTVQYTEVNGRYSMETIRKG